MDNALSFQLAKSVGVYFQLDNRQMNEIIDEVMKSCQGWGKVADEIGITRSEQELMSKAFLSPE